MEIYLIRHGHINRIGNQEDYFYKLSDIGNEQARKASIFVRDNIFNSNNKNILLSSNTIRTIETSLFFSEVLKTKLHIVDNVHEINMGFNDCRPKKEWLYVDDNNCFISRDGMTYEEKFKVRHYMGESPFDVYIRIKALEDIIYSSGCDSMYIVGHGTTLRLLTMRLLKKDIKWFYDEPIPTNCSVRKLVLTNKIVDHKYIGGNL